MSTITKKLSKIPYGNARVMNWDDGSKSLVSYTTTVLTLSSDGWLVVYGLYSATTRKHISAFMSEYVDGYNYYDAKNCYNKNVKLNIFTGEIVGI